MSPAYKLLTSTLLLAASLAATATAGFAQADASSARNDARDREIAARFAPAFRQAFSDDRRSDYITNFDFDNDWRGDNNWENAADTRFKLRAYVYYAVAETATHYFVHYAVFHPRDYKGGGAGPLLSEAIREGVRRGGRYDPTGISAGAVLAHENDMEGCLVVAAKSGDDLTGARVVAVQTLAHDRFMSYAPEGGFTAAADGGVSVEDNRAQLYVEPEGHGVSAYFGGRVAPASRAGLMLYKFAGRAEDPEASQGAEVGYELVPLGTTLWPRARKGVGETFGRLTDYGVFTVMAADARGRAASRKATLGRVGSSFAGKIGALHAARPPWGWFDRSQRAEKPGAWFFDPASTIKRRYNLGAEFSTVYRHAPFLGVFRR
jgi:hypothetical protein